MTALEIPFWVFVIVLLGSALGFALIRVWYWRRIAAIERGYAQKLQAIIDDIRDEAAAEIARRTPPDQAETETHTKENQ